jgi:predicted RNA-binding protein with PIN domain
MRGRGRRGASTKLGFVSSSSDRLFRRAIEAARKAIHDLDSDQVPAGLRRVAGQSGGLTPPLTLALLKAIDSYEWLREKALEAWPEADVKAEGPDQASALLLLRPDGWSARLAALAAAGGAEKERNLESDLARRLETAQSGFEKQGQRLRTEQQRHEAEVRELRERLELERAARRLLQAAPLRAEATRSAEIDRLAAAAASLEEERDQARVDARRSREALVGERRRRASVEADLAGQVGSESWSGDPLELAMRLDRVAAMARPAASEEVGGSPSGFAPLRLPEGVLPDDVAAFKWLARRREATTLVVDGYNAAFQLVEPGNAAEGRHRLRLLLERLVRVAVGSLRTIVIYDSAVDLDPAPPAANTVEIRFTSAGVSADDEIEALIPALDGPVVVVSSDREVRERAEASGALALWSEGLAQWWQRR